VLFIYLFKFKKMIQNRLGFLEEMMLFLVKGFLLMKILKFIWTHYFFQLSDEKNLEQN